MFSVGFLCICFGVVSYVAGVFDSYPGRAVSIPAVMVGITLVAISDGRILGRTNA